MNAAMLNGTPDSPKTGARRTPLLSWKLENRHQSTPTVSGVSPRPPSSLTSMETPADSRDPAGGDDGGNRIFRHFRTDKWTSHRLGGRFDRCNRSFAAAVACSFRLLGSLLRVSGFGASELPAGQVAGCLRSASASSDRAASGGLPVGAGPADPACAGATAAMARRWARRFAEPPRALRIGARPARSEREPRTRLAARAVHWDGVVACGNEYSAFGRACFFLARIVSGRAVGGEVSVYLTHHPAVSMR
jgi:hypothetical protein